MLEQQSIGVAAYAPDSAYLNRGSTDKTHNVFWVGGRCVPAPRHERYTGLPEGRQILNIFAPVNPDQTAPLFAGTADAIYILEGTAWRKVSPEFVQDIKRWSFCEFRHHIIAAAETAVREEQHAISVMIYRKDEGEDYPTFHPLRNLVEKPNGDEPLPVPVGSDVVACGDFLMIYGDQDNPSRLWWSGVKNPEFWEVGQLDSGFNDFPYGGDITGVVGQTSPFVFTRAATYKLVRVPQGFSQKTVMANRGNTVKGFVTNLDESAIFYSEVGFWLLDLDKESSKPIGLDRVNITHRILPEDTVTVFTDVPNNRYLINTLQRAQGAGVMMYYDANFDKWGILDENNVGISGASIRNTTLMGLQSQLGWQVLGDVLPSLDSPFWGGYSSLIISSKEDGLYFAGNSQASCSIASDKFGSQTNIMSAINTVWVSTDADPEKITITVNYQYNKGINKQIFTTEEKHPSSIDDGARVLVRCQTAELVANIGSVEEGNKWKTFEGFTIEGTGFGKR